MPQFDATFEAPAGVMQGRMRILYVRFAREGSGAEDGADIFDRKVIDALRRAGCDVKTIEISRHRSLGLPFWAQTGPRGAGQGSDARGDVSQRIVCSHESLFGLVSSSAVDMLIVHNYFPAFEFPKQRVLQFYYRAGARQYFARSFIRAKHVVFLSARDRAYAIKDFPGLASKAHFFPPPPYPARLLERRTDVVHVSGTANWLPKRLSRLTEAESREFLSRGFLPSDFGAAIHPAFGLIQDRFVVGFKLKLMQMVYSRDVIASMCNLDQDLRSVAPRYPFYRQVPTVGDALRYFQEVARKLPISDIDAAFESSGPHQIPSWSDLGIQLKSLLDGD